MWLAYWEPQFLQEDKAGQRLQALQPHPERIITRHSNLARAISPIVSVGVDSIECDPE
jgi:hypothetical protein